MKEQDLTRKPEVVLLDVYDTLIDMGNMERKINSMLDSTRGYVLWFELLMQHCFADNCTGHFNDFLSIAKATMQMTGKLLGRSPDSDSIDEAIELLKHLPVYEGVPEGLSALADLGFRMAALTNTPEKILRDRMEPTGLISYFEMLLSAEHVKKYKPCVEVYLWAAQKMGVDPGAMLMVTSHGWDIAGAANAGMQTALFKKTKSILYPLAPEPNLTCTSLQDLAAQFSQAQRPALDPS